MCGLRFILRRCQEKNRIASNGRMLMNNELKRIWKEAALTVSKYYSEICLEGLRKDKKHKPQLR
jgi:hypothetical protein